MYINLKNIRIHYKIFGTGKDLVLLPGWGHGFESYSTIISYLAKTNRVIAIDLPGFGLSSPPQAIWKTPQYAECIAELLTVLNIKEPILVGHSFGGKVSLFLVAQNLVTSKKLILISSNGIRIRKKNKQYIKIYFFKLLKKIIDLPILKCLFALKLEKYRNKIGSLDYRQAKGIMRKILVSTVNEDFRDILPKINVPTLLIWGDLDTSVPLVVGRLMQELIPMTKLVIFKGAEHFPHTQDFGRFCKEVTNFLADPSAPTQKISE